MIKEEICDAEKYANCALQYKDDDKILAETFYSLANNELQHMDTLHTQVVRLSNEYKTKKGEPPKEMQVIYDYLHEEQIESVKEVKLLLSMYKG
jgi:hypothetical protein